MEIEGLPRHVAAMLKARQVEVPIDRSRACPVVHPTPAELEDSLDELPWRWVHGVDTTGRPFQLRQYDCPECHGSGIVNPPPDNGPMGRDGYRPQHIVIHR